MKMISLSTVPSVMFTVIGPSFLLLESPFGYLLFVLIIAWCHSLHFSSMEPSSKYSLQANRIPDKEKNIKKIKLKKNPSSEWVGLLCEGLV